MNGSIKVLHVLKSSTYSGAENVVITIIKNLPGNYESAYAASDGEIRFVLEKEKIKHYLFDKFTLSNLIKVVKDFDPDIIHAHDFSATVACANLRGRFRIISHLHYDPPWVKTWNLRTMVYVLSTSKISKVLSVSAKSFENMVFSKLIKKKYENVRNPIDIKRVLALGNLDEQVGIYDLLFVGRFVEQKNPQRFINIVNLLAQKGQYLKCAMLGVGDLTEECEQLIAHYGLQKQIELLGFKKNPYIYMKSAKLLCVTSKWEGYGLVVVEANILGTPVLSSYTSGVVEVLGENAIELCGSDQEFIDKIQLLLNNYSEYEEWKNMTLKRVKQLTKLDEYIRKIDQVYRNIL